MDLLNAIAALYEFCGYSRYRLRAQLALGALGVTLIYGILRFSNFAHGDNHAFGAMITILPTWAFQEAGITLGPLPTALLALPIGIVVTTALLLATDRTIYAFYRKQHAKPVVLLIVSIGVMFMMNGLVRFIIGPEEQRFADGAPVHHLGAGFPRGDRAERRNRVQNQPRADHCRRRHLRGHAVLVPESDTHRQVDAGLFR